MRPGIFEFFIANTQPSDFNNKRILEVGSRDVNGSIRPYILTISQPESYTGVDIQAGKCVDVILDAESLVDHFGENVFDVVICCEMVEHVKNWQLIFGNLKRVLKTSGLMILTTVMPGFPFHQFPFDYWRYGRNDMSNIFSDFEVLTIGTDSEIHGIYVKALKPENWQPNNLEGIQLHSMERERKLANYPEYHLISFRVSFHVKERYLRIVRPLYRFLFPRNK
ncbi:MAG: class I SAM-dependent methyltransferase [Candidatus Bathyarchaeia archaeon]